jgi:hypothetical protein
MDPILDLFTTGVRQLVGRLEGPLHFRFFTMPLVASFFAIRSGLRDAREGRLPFSRAVFAARGAERRRLRRSWLRDIGRVFLVGLALDVGYQLFVLRWIYPGQALIVAFVCAVLPYVLVRGPTTAIARRYRARAAGPAV